MPNPVDDVARLLASFGGQLPQNINQSGYSDLAWLLALGGAPFPSIRPLEPPEPPLDIPTPGSGGGSTSGVLDSPGSGEPPSDNGAPPGNQPSGISDNPSSTPPATSPSGGYTSTVVGPSLTADYSIPGVISGAGKGAIAGFGTGIGAIPMGILGAALSGLGFDPGTAPHGMIAPEDVPAALANSSLMATPLAGPAPDIDPTLGLSGLLGEDPLGETGLSGLDGLLGNDPMGETDAAAVAAADAAADAAGSVTGMGSEADSSGIGELLHGGPVPDRFDFPGGEEPILAHDKEFVMNPLASTLFRPILEEINSDPLGALAKMMMSRPRNAPRP